jgi:hypothetical protein
VTDEQHLSSEQLVRVAARDLDEQQHAAALRHLEECEECGDRLAAVLLLRRRRSGLSRPLRFALAAAVLVVVVAGAWMAASMPFGEPAEEPLSPERQMLVDRFAGYASTENVDPRLYDFVLRLDYPDIIPVGPDQHLPRARQAVVDLRDGRYERAVDQLADLAVEYPDFDSIAGWLGVALHLSGEIDPVVQELLERGRRSGIDPLERMCQWYGAQHLLLVGQPERAVDQLRDLSRSPVRLGRMAKAQLEELPLDELDVREQSPDPSV